MNERLGALRSVSRAAGGPRRPRPWGLLATAGVLVLLAVACADSAPNATGTQAPPTTTGASAQPSQAEVFCTDFETAFAAKNQDLAGGAVAVGAGIYERLGAMYASVEAEAPETVLPTIQAIRRIDEHSAAGNRQGEAMGDELRRSRRTLQQWLATSCNFEVDPLEL